MSQYNSLFISHLLYLIKQAWGSLKNSPGFVFSVITSLGISIGSLLAVLTLGYFMLFKPLPYPESDRLMKINYQRFDSHAVLQTDTYLHPAAVALYKTQQKLQQTDFSELALLYYGEEVLSSEAGHPTLATTYTTPQWFDLLAIPMALGRSFNEQEGFDSFIPGAMLTYQSWQQNFNGVADILSKHIIVKGISHPIIGVTAEHFIEPEIFQTGHHTQLWLPWDFNSSDYHDYWGLPDNRVVLAGRLKADVFGSQAAKQLSNLAQALFIEQTNGQAFYQQWRVNIDFQPFRTAISENSLYTLLLLLAGLLGLVMIAATNIANLFMAHTLAQQHQLAISAALGANKSQLQLALFFQSGLLMAFATLVAIIIAQVCFALMQHYFASFLPRVSELSLTILTVSCAIFIALSLAYIFAWLSTTMINYPSLNTLLQSGNKGTGFQVSKKARHTLICAQISIATTLVFASSLLLDDAIKQWHHPLAFNTEQLLEVEFSVATLNWLGWDHYAPKVEALKHQLLLRPEIENISFARSPLDDRHQFPAIDVKTNQRFYPFHRNVDHRYLNVVQQRLLTGSSFTEEDVREQTPVVMVNETFAQRLSTDQQSVLGKKLLFNQGKPVTILGVVQNLQLPSKRKAPPRIYLTNYGTATFFLIKLKPYQTLSREQMIELLAETDSQFVLSKFEKMSNNIDKARFPHLLTAITAAVIAVFTIFLAGIGLYGILSYSTQKRRFEIGTRLAIGAKRKDIIKLIFKDNASIILLGILTSIITLLLLILGFSEQLTHYINWRLLPMFLITLTLINIISFCACYLPLRQYINQPAIVSLKGSD